MGLLRGLLLGRGGGQRWEVLRALSRHPPAYGAAVARAGGSLALQQLRRLLDDVVVDPPGEAARPHLPYKAKEGSVGEV